MNSTVYSTNDKWIFFFILSIDVYCSLIFDKGANINPRNKKKQTALIEAALEGKNISVVTFLNFELKKNLHSTAETAEKDVPY